MTARPELITQKFYMPQMDHLGIKRLNKIQARVKVKICSDPKCRTILNQSIQLQTTTKV